MEQDELKKILEALLFITDQPITVERLVKVTEVADKDRIRAAVAELQTSYMEGGRAIQIVEVAGGYQMSTKPEFGRYVRKLYNERMTSRLSVAAMETLAIIAYRQPITRAEVETIRGVEVIAPLETILERGLVKVVGRKETVGRPLLYGTTEEFLRVFGLNSLDDLPKLESLELKPAEMPQPELPLGTEGQPPAAPTDAPALEDGNAAPEAAPVEGDAPVSAAGEEQQMENTAEQAAGSEADTVVPASQGTEVAAENEPGQEGEEQPLESSEAVSPETAPEREAEVPAVEAETMPEPAENEPAAAAEATAPEEQAQGGFSGSGEMPTETAAPESAVPATEETPVSDGQPVDENKDAQAAS